MNRLTIIAAFFALLLLRGHSVLAQSGYDLFQKGLVKERTEGNLEEAIHLYKQIVDEYNDDRALVAKALVQMGQCYEKLARAEARKAYERVVREFADQTEPARVARQHLEKLNGGTLGTPGNGSTYRLVLDEKITGVPVGGKDISLSGDRIVFISQGKLFIADETGAVIRPILEDLGSWENPVWPRWSPDGRQIAYRAEREIKSESGTRRVYSIFILSPDGGVPRKVGSNVRTRIRWPLWTPDGKNLTYLIHEGIRTVSLDSEEVLFIPKKDVSGFHRSMGLNSYSPDGRWLVYHTRNQDTENTSYRTDLYILPATGGTARCLTPLVGIGGTFAAWAPDGQSLYFVSWKSGSGNIWKIAMDPVKGLPKGESQQVTFFSGGTGIAIPKVLGEGDQIAFHMRRTSTVIQVADASTPQESRSLVRSGKYSPELSPDGQTIYYVNDGLGEEGIYAVSCQGGTPRRLTEILPGKVYPYAPLDLSPDGRTLAYAIQSGGKGGLFTLPVSGGEPKLLVEIKQWAHWAFPHWSPDGSLLAYADGKDLYVIGAAGGQPRKLATFEGYLEGYSIRWSPNGKYIASLGSSDDSNNAVFVVPASGGELRRLTPVTTWLQRLEWHPDGKRLTYHASLGNSETRQAYLDGRPPSLLLNAPGVWDYEGAWAPDGRRFFFLADGGLHVYDETSGETTFVADCGSSDEESVPSWSRDGKTMAWSATRRTTPQLWIMENFLPKSSAAK
jgi:Tol biopolymer transport system component